MKPLLVVILVFTGVICLGIIASLIKDTIELIKTIKSSKTDKKDKIKNYSFILDFTNEGGWLSEEDLARDVLYASPGVPCSLDKNSKKVFSESAIYDNLEIGTAIMLGMAVLT